MLEIVMIEDDLELAAILTSYLSAHDIRVSNYDEPYTGISAIKAHHYDLLLLDLTLPNLDGLEVCKRLAKDKKIPIIITSARGDINDRVQGLELGADDYLAKPYDPKELLARIHSVLRRAENSANAASNNSNTLNAPNDETIKFTPFSLNLARREIRLNGKILDLTRAEFDILSLMLQNQNIALSRDNIATSADSISPDSTNKSIDVIIGRLRAKIENNEQKFIYSVRGVGYKFVLDSM